MLRHYSDLLGKELFILILSNANKNKKRRVINQRKVFEEGEKVLRVNFSFLESSSIRTCTQRLKARLFNTNYKGTTTVRHQYMIGLELRPRPKTRDPTDKVFSLDYELDSQLS